MNYLSMVVWNLREMGPGSGEGGIFLRVCEDPKGHNHFPWYRTDFCFIYVETGVDFSERRVTVICQWCTPRRHLLL